MTIEERESREEWTDKWVVKQESILSEQGRKVWVSTVCINKNVHNYPNMPESYETMVFPYNEKGVVDYRELDSDHYYTREYAEKGHTAMVAKWQEVIES